MSTNASSTLTATAPRVAGAGQRWGGMLLRSTPNLVVFALLAGLFYVGHSTGWKLPSAAQLRGEAAAVPDDWCDEHLVPESQCVECHDALLPRPKSFGFCKRHGVTECVTCNPELAQVADKPRLPQYDTVEALAVVARAENNSRNTLHRNRVQFSSAEAASKAGIDVDVAQERPMTDAIEANGEILFDSSRVAHLSSRVHGTVAFVRKTLGDSVRPGEIVATIDGAEVGKAKSELLHAVVQAQLRQDHVARLREVEVAVTRRSLVEAEAALEEAKIRYVSARQALVNLGFDLPEKFASTDVDDIAEELRLLGLPEEIAGDLPQGVKTANLIAIRAPYEGVIVESDVVAGEVVDTADVLFTIANPRHVWLVLNVGQEDARYLQAGLPVEFRSDNDMHAATGRISWISPAIDQRTRTLQTRVALDPGQEGFRDKTFGTGRIILRQEPQAVVVPRAAVQTASDAQFIFVRDRDYLQAGAPKVFHVRQVRLGARDDKYVEVLAGVLPGEVVASEGASVLYAHVLRSNFGAGCGCHEQ